MNGKRLICYFEEELRAQVESADRIGLCCINMDYGTPDGNVRAVLEAAARAWNARPQTSAG